jgi:hypothetical protein
MKRARQCSHGKGNWMVLLTRKNELKKIKRCMRLRKIGVCEVMKDKAMEIDSTWMTNKLEGEMRGKNS